jgi:hypothetical protein
LGFESKPEGRGNWRRLKHRLYIALEASAPGIPKEVTSRVDEVRAQGTHLGKAGVVTGYAVKHVIAQVTGLVGALMMLLGTVLVGLGVFWRRK